MNGQQQLILGLGGGLILVQAIKTGLLKDLWNLIMGNPTGLGAIPRDLVWVILESLFIALLMYMASDSSEFGAPTVGLVAVLALWVVYVVVNGDQVALFGHTVSKFLQG